MAKILITGDLCPIYRVENLFEEEKYSEVLGDVRHIIADCDYAITNLEAPICKGNEVAILKSGPNLKTSDKVIGALKYAGFDMVALANNHLYDYGSDAVLNTLEVLDTNNIDFVGAGRNIEDARNFYIKTINNRKIAIINFCENEWSIATEKSAGSNPLDVISNFYQIKRAKEQADSVLVIIHGGHEGYQLPSPRMKEMYRFLVDVGADAVINHHQHCFSGYEIYNKKPIFYGLGNFCFDSLSFRNNIWNQGFFVVLDIEESINFTIYPYNQCNEQANIRLLSLQEKVDFDKEIHKLNSIISNSEILMEKFVEFCDQRQRSSLNYLEPYSNKYLVALKSRGLIPTLLSASKRRLILNLFRCESHSDVMLSNLKE